MRALPLVADAREGGAWALHQRWKNDAIHAAVVLALRATRGLRPQTLVKTGRILGALVHDVAAPLRTASRRGAAIGLAELSRERQYAIVRESFMNLGGHVGAMLAALHGASPALLPFAPASREVLREAAAEGRGVVLPSAHLGPWEQLAATLAAAFPFCAIVRESYDPRLQDIVTRMRERVGFAAIPRGAPGAPVRIVRVLRAGGVLGVPMDLATRAPSVSVPFLGREARTALGPARLAVRTGAPVVVCTVEPEGGALTVTCTRLPPEADEVALLHRINEELGRRILRAPEQWPWLHARWGS